jgi:hypothetical protein
VFVVNRDQYLGSLASMALHGKHVMSKAAQKVTPSRGILFDVPHLRFDPASGMAFDPSLPEGQDIATCGAWDIV